MTKKETKKETQESYDEMMRELRETYLTALVGRIAMAQALTEKLDWPELYELFHKIKGTGTTYGFPDLTHLCQRMEDLCRDKDERRPEHLKAALELLNYLLQNYQSEKNPEMMKQPQARVIWPAGGTP